MTQEERAIFALTRDISLKNKTKSLAECRAKARTVYSSILKKIERKAIWINSLSEVIPSLNKTIHI